MDSTRDLSVGELLEQLLADSLIDACHITGEFVTIVQGTKRHSFPYRQARTFLMGMLRGRSWNLNQDDEEQPPLRSVGKRPGDVDTAVLTEHIYDTDVGQGPTGPSVRLLGPALDELLSMAEDMELIEGFSIDAESSIVTIVLSACQTQMQLDEAVVFLSECILYKLHSLREELSRLQDESARPARRQAESPVRARVAGEEPVWQPLV